MPLVATASKIGIAKRGAVECNGTLLNFYSFH